MLSRSDRGQVLVLAALTISLVILSTQAYIYQRSKTDSYADGGALSDYVLSVEQGSRHVVVASLIDGGGWLSGWDRRVKITIDHNDVDGNLSDFPILIYLSTSSGRNNDDVSFVFDELQSDDNRRKIAVTTSDGATQCYVEIEKWDDANEKAWLWVKVPSINSTTETDLYLYYDAEHTNNTDYVEDTGSTTAQNVWDDDFVGVWHLSEDPSGDAPQMKNSKSDAHHGTSLGSMTISDQVSGQIDGSLDFDGWNDYIDCGNAESLDITTDITMEVWLKADSFSDGPYILTKGEGYGDRLYSIRLRDTGTVRFYLNDDRITSTTPLSTGIWYYIAATRSGNIRKIFIGGTEDISDTYGTAIRTTTDPLTISASSDTFNGIIDDTRLSKTGRSDAWIKASYESGRDDLVDFGSEETKDGYYRGRATSNLRDNLDRWKSFVGGDYSFGRCDLNATAASQPPYSEGVWLDWGTDGMGVSSASADFTMNLSDRGAEIDWSFTENMTTTVMVSGSYDRLGTYEKQVTVVVNLLNEGEPTLAGTITLSYFKSWALRDPSELSSYSWQDFGNGTYRYSFTDSITSSTVRVHVETYDRRGIFAQAEASLYEG